ncbi:MAG: lamin tail domain-containing protein [Deltaproteobacteria bacterium]|nr:lamin tail domain-containing protein [Deltaproteobacteria bacterium]
MTSTPIDQRRPNPPRTRAGLVGALSLLAALVSGCPTSKPSADAAVAVYPCDDDPYGVDENGDDCPCVTDPTQDFCPDPCSLEPPAAQCKDTASGDTTQPDAGGDAPDAKPDAPDAADATDAKDTVDTNPPLDVIEDTTDEDIPLEDGTDELDSEIEDTEPPPDVADVPDIAPDTGADIKPDGILQVPDGSVKQGDGTYLYPDGNVVPKEDIPVCTLDKDCIGPVKACYDIKCLVDPTVSGGRRCDYLPQSYGAQCDDKNFCSTADKCDGKGACLGTPVACIDSDDDVCTAPSCDPLKGCVATKAATGTACNDGNPCTAGESCYNGKCDSQTADNACACASKLDCLAYEDGNLCNGTLTCKSGACVVDSATIPKPCDATQDTACIANTCDPKSGVCVYKWALYGSVCSDGDACDGPDLCINGACKGTGAVNCDDKNPCTVDSCDKLKGCQHLANSLLCDDGNPCTTADACVGGACTGTVKASCSCTTGADCAQFEDGNACNGTLKCSKGTCTVDLASVVQCADAGPCVAQACDPSTGKCAGQNLPAGTPCSDGSQCTYGDVCSAVGTCMGGTKLECDDKNPCTSDSCDGKFGCIHGYLDGAACSDGNPCTLKDKCKAGKCQPGADQCECTADSDCQAKVAASDKCFSGWACVETDSGSRCLYDPKKTVTCTAEAAASGCASVACEASSGTCKTTNVVDATPCDDKVFCTILDRCIGGTCTGDQNTCSDGQPCTADNCDDTVTVGDACKHDPNTLDGLACSDGSACTSGDLCKTGKCSGELISCDDKNACTVDTCDKAVGCTHTPAENTTPCDDQNACTGDSTQGGSFAQDHCDGAGTCKSGDPKICTTSEPCIEIPCNPTATTLPSGGGKLGCENKIPQDGKACNDGNACTDGDVCQGANCASGLAMTCDDDNACTQDACDKVTGCTHTATQATCDDKDPCTDNDACSTGVCKGTPADCNDENVCTTDACVPGAGCTYKPVAGDCGDFADCSSDATPTCAFKGGVHLVISEVYVGNPTDPSDDWVEIFNPTEGTAQLADYALEARPFDANTKDPWTLLAKGKASTTLPPHRYVLFGAGAVAQAGVSVDVTAATTFKLAMPLKNMPGKAGCTVDSLRHLQLRLRDTAHELEHDRVSWDDGQAAVVPIGMAPVDSSALSWPSYTSIERHASAQSEASSMAPHRPEWLAGNGYDTGKDVDDFLVRLWPEPQNLAAGKFEPACGGTCSLGKVCNFSSVSQKCIDDIECESFGVTGALGCGSGKVCGNGTMVCIPDPAGSVVISEVYFGTDGEQYLELYNASSKAVNLSGWLVQKKDADVESFKPWIVNVVAIPANTVLAGKHYFLIGTQAWARTHGQVDLIPATASAMDPAGGSLRLYDPSSDTELDLLGWGAAVTYSNAGVGAQYKPAAAVEALGSSLERKAKNGATVTSMAPGGGADLAGNALDTNNDSSDFIVADPTPQTMGAGVYEPACAGTCPNGLVCNYLGGAAEKCVDPLCGGACVSKMGYGCNPKTQECDLKVLIAEVATEGPPATNQKGNPMLAAENEYIVLYNPSASTIDLAKTTTANGKTTVDTAMVLQMQNPTDTLQTSITDQIPTGKPLIGSVPPHSYFLIAPLNYDASLPAPDFQSSKPFNLPSAGGVVRIATMQNVEFDRVAWGTAAAAKAEGKAPAEPQVSATCGDGQGGAIRRRGLVPGAASDYGDPTKPAFHCGAGFDTGTNPGGNNSTDWVRIPQRTPHSQKCTWPSLAGQTGPMCVGYPIHNRP